MTGAAAEPAAPRLSIVVPVLNEQAQLPPLLDHLCAWRALAEVEVLVVDGGSGDDSLALLAAGGFTPITATRGRATQMNAGAAHARGDFLLFLHADTRLPPPTANFVHDFFAALARPDTRWGRFDVIIDGDRWLLRVIAFFMNWRSRLSGIATGDQCIFVHRETFAAVGGFPEQPLMEDIELSARLLARARPLCLRHYKALTSGRRWHQHGVLPTILLMWRLRLAYRLGASSARLAKRYGY